MNKLDQLLQNMNDALDGRNESDIELTDSYWNARNSYQQALAQADGVHVPDEPEEVKVRPLNEQLEELQKLGII